MHWIETHEVRDISFDDLCELADKPQDNSIVRVTTSYGFSASGWPCEVNKKQDFVILCPGKPIKTGPRSESFVGDPMTTVRKDAETIYLETYSWTKLERSAPCHLKKN